MSDPSWDIPYLHSPEKPDEDEFAEDDFSSPDTAFVVRLGGSKTRYNPRDFLQACWTNGFDTPCTICHERFDLATSPPVRLLGLEQALDHPDPLTAVLPPLTITNYHLRCLKSARVKYFPISHAWLPSIAEAYALRVFNPGAAQACYEVPIRTLLAVVRRFGPGVHLWHDYISIPQWQDEFRGTTILPQMFQTFKASGCAIIHLAIQPPAEVMQTPTLDTLIKHEAEFKRFFDAHLFHRLWPVVEFTRAEDAYIMSSKYDIMADTFSVFMTRILDTSGANIDSPQSPGQPALEWTSHLPLFVRERQKNKCLGYVFDMISNQGCRSFRDKTIGAAELLDVSDYPTKLPADPQDACLWLAERQLETNDFSPLLLRPSAEQKFHKARWLKGHTAMTAEMWGWGVQTQAASVPPQLKGHAVSLELELVGTVEKMLSLTPNIGDSCTNVGELISRLVSLANRSTQVFVENLQGVPPSQLLGTANTTETAQLSELQYQIPASGPIHAVLGDVLKRYTSATKAGDHAHLTSLRSSLLSLIALSTSQPPPDLTSFQGLNMLHLSRQLCDSSEHALAFISCPSCRMSSVLRVHVWQMSGARAQLYLVPGLGYQYSVPGGTGIIVESGEIIGRVRFGASACTCRRRVVVELT